MAFDSLEGQQATFEAMRAFFSDISKGISAFTRAVGFIFRHGLWYYFLFPFVITLAIWIGGFTLVSDMVTWLDGKTHAVLQLEPSVVEEGRMSWFWSFWETMKDWWNSGSVVLLAIVVKLAFFLILLVTNKYVMLALLSPALALISEKTEEVINGTTYPFHLGQFLKDILRGTMVALRNFFAEMAFMLVIWIITLAIPFLAPFSAAASLIISSYYYGFSMIDYWNERQRMSLKEGFRFIRQRRGASVALGVPIALAVKVPILGFALAGAASIIGAVGAVLAVDKGSAEAVIQKSSLAES